MASTPSSHDAGHGRSGNISPSTSATKASILYSLSGASVHKDAELKCRMETLVIEGIKLREQQEKHRRIKGDLARLVALLEGHDEFKDLAGVLKAFRDRPGPSEFLTIRKALNTLHQIEVILDGFGAAERSTHTGHSTVSAEILSWSIDLGIKHLAEVIEGVLYEMYDAIGSISEIEPYKGLRREVNGCNRISQGMTRIKAIVSDMQSPSASVQQPTWSPEGAAVSMEYRGLIGEYHLFVPDFRQCLLELVMWLKEAELLSH